MESFHMILSIASFIGVAYLLGRVSSLERQVKALNWTAERHYEWLRLTASDQADIKACLVRMDAAKTGIVGAKFTSEGFVYMQKDGQDG